MPPARQAPTPAGTVSVRCLSFHSRYRCRQQGACCTARWPIPVEADRLVRLQAAVATGRLRVASDSTPWVSCPPGAPTETPALLGTTREGCVFFEAASGGSCRVHAVLGHDALPLACRQFPRVSVIDPRGVSVTLSHYCPTAADLLDGHGRVTIAADPPGLFVGPGDAGLDVRTSLPPLLRPDMLMDWASWWEWERLAVALLGRSEPIEQSMNALAACVETARTWVPSRGELTDHVRLAFEQPVRSRLPAVSSDWDRCLATVHAAVPDDLQVAPLVPVGRPPERVIRRFLLAHAFANWTAHLGHGLRTWLQSLIAPWALLEAGLGVRQADLLLRHLADPSALAERWSAAERDGS
jgi:hypothetical protein